MQQSSKHLSSSEWLKVFGRSLTMLKVAKKMDAEMTAFAADVLESINQAKRIEFAQDSFIKHLMATPQIRAGHIDEFGAKRLDIQLRTIDLSDFSSHHSIDE